jgi:4-diphosphocytidyl-2-C-methyl-D-erythritol kinase
MTRLQSHAPAKINLALSVLARRADGYHELTSLVAFADVGDTLSLEPGPALDLFVGGPTAEGAGKPSDNLVLRAARAAEERIEGLKLGHFALTKRLPAGSGLGGGSSDAAAALRLIAQANDLAAGDRRLLDAALAVGADVPACLDPRARLMHGIGEMLSEPLPLPPLDAVLVFPGVAVRTANVFSSFTLAAGARRKTRYTETEIPHEQDALLRFLAAEGNDLELAARLVAPAICEAREALEQAGKPLLVRMTGSGSAVFGIYDSAADAQQAAETILARKPDWWVKATVLK